MSEEQNNEEIEAPAEEAAEAPAKPKRTRARKPAAAKPAAAKAEEPAAEEKPKPARKPRTTKKVEEPVAEAADEPVAEAAAEAPAEAPAAEEKPKPARKPRTTKKVEEPVAEEKPPARAPKQRRGAREEHVAVVAPVVRAQAKYVRSSARKARLVCDHIRGKSVDEARAILAHTPRAVAKDWSKLLESAVANAEHNHELVGEDLVIKAVQADEGPTIKRFRPRAQGRATAIRKRTSHLTILLTPKN